MMKKTIAAATIALTLAGAGFALAQQATPREERGSRPSAEDVAGIHRCSRRRPQGRVEAHRRAGEELACGRDRDPRSGQGARRPHGHPPRGAARRRQCAAAQAGCHRAAAPGRRCHDHARGKPQEARRCRRAALQEPRRRPEAPLRQCCCAWAAGPAVATATGSAAPTTAAEAAHKPAAAAFLLPDERRAPEAAGHVSGGFFLFSRRAGFLQMGCIAGQPRAALLQHASLRGSPASRPGRIAQLVEQLTLNQRVPGSSPGAPTNKTRHFSRFRRKCLFILTTFLTMCRVSPPSTFYFPRYLLIRQEPASLVTAARFAYVYSGTPSVKIMILTVSPRTGGRPHAEKNFQARTSAPPASVCA